MASNLPVVLPACTPSEMLKNALRHSPAKLLICHSRPAFLDSLMGKSPEDQLLHASLQQIVNSRSIEIAFLPTLSHLRAYLAVLSPRIESESRRISSLIVYGMINLHRDTSEWSAQGLGVTMASLVEGGSRLGYEIFLCEEDIILEVMEERHDSQGNERRRSNCWQEEMPILNGSTRRLIAGSQVGWAGKTVEVGRVLQRWCVFRE